MYPGSKIFKCHAAKLLVHMDDILFYVHEGKKKKTPRTSTDCLPEPRRVKRDEQNFCGHVELFLLMH